MAIVTLCLEPPQQPAATDRKRAFPDHDDLPTSGSKRRMIGKIPSSVFVQLWIPECDIRFGPVPARAVVAVPKATVYEHGQAEAR